MRKILSLLVCLAVGCGELKALVQGVMGPDPGPNLTYWLPFSVFVASNGSVYVTEPLDYRVTEFVLPAAKTDVISGYVGMPIVRGANPPDGNAVPYLWGPVAAVLDSQTNLFVVDKTSSTIRKLTPANVLSTFASEVGFWDPMVGPIAPLEGDADGVGTAARFRRPEGITVGSNDVLFVADTGNHTIRRITPGGIVTTWLGTAGQAGTNDGVGTSARFRFPVGLSIDAEDNLLVADAGNHTIRKVSPNGIVTTLAGIPGSAGFEDGPRSGARFTGPRGVAAGPNGSVFVADTDNYTIRQVSRSGVTTTIAGLARTPGAIYGSGDVARLYGPMSISVAPDGSLWIVELANSTPIRTFTVPNLRITNQPLSKTSFSGTNTSLSVTANGAVFLGYQWIRNGSPLVTDVSFSGVTNSTLTITNLSRIHAGNYSVIVTDSSGSITSNVSALTIKASQLIKSPTPLPDGRFQLRFNDADGSLLDSSDAAKFEVQLSTNLLSTNWMAITNGLVFTNGQFQFTDPDAASAQRRYYRVVEK